MDETQQVSVDDQPWRWIGWDGIRFRVPELWRPGGIGRRHLFFNDQSSPVLEIKWSLPGSNLRAERIIAQLGGKNRGDVTIGPVPPEWEKALAGRPAAGFAWAGTQGHARGVACRLACGTWTIVQFFGPHNGQVPQTLLASLDDRAEQDGRLWSLYDVTARIPPAFGLIQWQFAAGAFWMAFSGAGRRLSIYRFAPAAVILKTQDLNDMAGKLLAGAKPIAVDGEAGDWLLTGSGPGRWFGRLVGMDPVVQRLRLWHLAAANRILGVWLKGRGVIGADMDAICQAYGCLGS